MADFLRELYGIIQTDTGITREQILSDSKTHDIVKERSIISCLLYNRFDFLSTVDIGIMLGEIGNPKNHVTIMNGLKRCNRDGFSPEFYRKEKILELYEKVKKTIPI